MAKQWPVTNVRFGSLADIISKSSLMAVLTSYIFRTTESWHSVSGSYFGPSSKRTFPDFSIVPS